jgi:oxalate decarboxylase/phosphoglucose isomerase-like protein (cupin superfamily)
MSPLQRREFLGAAGLAAATSVMLMRPKAAEAGDPSFMNNVPDPLLAGEDLPNFKFELEKSEGKIIDGVKQLPISKGIAGVSMKLAPGAMRELHWHATAAKWAFVDKGRVRTTVLAPGGCAETNDFGPGDVWYFPRGHGHMLELEPGALRELHWHPGADEWQYVLEGKVSITLFGSGGRYRTETFEKGDVGYSPQGYGHSIENVGNGKCRVLTGFNSGTYEEIDL